MDVSVGGVTLRASMPESAVEEIGGLGERVRIFTYLNVRDDNITLFGFPTEEARSAFEALITVSGVGPRLALAILSALSTDALAAAIDGSDTSAFKSASGVGTKTANRIVLELKGKLDWEPIPSPGAQGGDLVSALMALGYTAGRDQGRDLLPAPRPFDDAGGPDPLHHRADDRGRRRALTRFGDWSDVYDSVYAYVRQDLPFYVEEAVASAAQSWSSAAARAVSPWLSHAPG